MTELVISNMDPVSARGKIKAGYTGAMLPNMQAKVVDLETGLSLPPNQDGEICMRSPSV